MSEHKHSFEGGHACTTCGISLEEYGASLQERLGRLHEELAQRKALNHPDDDPKVIAAAEERIAFMERALTSLSGMYRDQNN